MKFKTTLILLAVFVALLALVLLLDFKKESDTDNEGKLVDLVSEDIQKIIFKTGEETITFKREKEDEWLIIHPLEAKADKYEVDRMADDFAALSHRWEQCTESIDHIWQLDHVHFRGVAIVWTPAARF